jgi:RNA polymerase sigma factor (TIGR02999 family)
VSDEEDLDALFAAIYEQLRGLAAAVRRGSSLDTLNPTALVNEVWIRLRRTPEVSSRSPLHFKRIAARAMRQVLIEAARRKHAEKRGGGAGAFVTYDRALEQGEPRHEETLSAEDLLTIDTALVDLEKLSPVQARIVEHRYFAGYSAAETAELVGMSESTVAREWRAARAWLLGRLTRSN